VRKFGVPVSNCSEHKMVDGPGTHETTGDVLLLAAYFVRNLQGDSKYPPIQIVGRHACRTIKKTISNIFLLRVRELHKFANILRLTV
jgi:hypothetical protein